MMSAANYFKGDDDPWGMTATTPKAKNIMEHLQVLKYFHETKIAKERLLLVVEHIDDPDWIAENEKEWLNEPEYWNGYYGSNRQYTLGGNEWE